MPTLSLNAFTPQTGGNFFQPQIVGRAPDADLIRRTNLAKLAQLEQEPRLREQEFQERMREFNLGAQERGREATETERYHRGEESYRGEELAFRHDELSQHIAAMKEQHQAEVLRATSEYATRAGLAPEVMADTLRRAGYPELSQSIAASSEAKSEQQYQSRLAQTKAAKPDVRAKLIAGYDEPTQRRIRSDILRGSTEEAVRGTPAGEEAPTGGAGVSMWGPTANVSSLFPSTSNWGMVPSGRTGGFFDTKAQESAARKKRGADMAITPP